MSTPDADAAKVGELVERALNVIRSDRLPYLATMDGDQPRLRPVAPVKTEGFTVYVANLRPHNKTSEIKANPRVELCYLDGTHDQVRITGLAEEVTDPTMRREVFAANPQVRKCVGGIVSTDFILYRIVPTRVRYMKEWALTYQEVPFS
jgi:uncharacterized pyridoxamine 5'-phosphate oxidase family protein